MFGTSVDATLKATGIRTLKSPPRAPKANAFVERAIGTHRRECLHPVIPVPKYNLRRILDERVVHSNRGGLSVWTAQG